MDGVPFLRSQIATSKSFLRRSYSTAALRYLLHDRDSKYSAGVDDLLLASGIKPLKLPARSPNLNAYAERFVRSIKHECLDRLILFGEKSLRYVLREYISHYHAERNHQGIGNAIPFPDERLMKSGKIIKSQRLGGLLNFYHGRCALKDGTQKNAA